jgi:hypothetical protein
MDVVFLCPRCMICMADWLSIRGYHISMALLAFIRHRFNAAVGRKGLSHMVDTIDSSTFVQAPCESRLWQVDFSTEPRRIRYSGHAMMP